MTDLSEFDALVDDVGELSDEFVEGGRQEYEPRVLPGNYGARVVALEPRKTQDGKLTFSATVRLDDGEDIRFVRLGVKPYFRPAPGTPKGVKGAPNTSGLFEWLHHAGYEGTLSQLMRPGGRPVTSQELVGIAMQYVDKAVGVETELQAMCKTPTCKGGQDRGEKFKYASKLPKTAEGGVNYKPTCPTCQQQLTAFPYVLRFTSPTS